MRTRATLAIIAFWTLWLALPSTGTAAPAPATGGTTARAAGTTARTTGTAARTTGTTARAAGTTTPTAGDRAGEIGGDPDGAGTARDDLERAGPVVPVGGPPIGAVLSAAYTAAGLDHDPGRSWILRARLGGLVPWVTVRTTRDTSWQDTQSEVGHGSTFEVRATWRLDRLVFDGRELQVTALEAARRRERRRLANRVIRSYFTWRRATEAALATDDERARTRMAEATAELDALTDGWFSDELARAQRGAAGSQARRAAPP